MGRCGALQRRSRLAGLSYYEVQTVSKHAASLLVRLANALSLARLASVPVIILLIWEARESESLYYAAFWLAFSLQVGDMLDGYLARKGTSQLDAPNEFGEVIDPIADKMYIGAAFITLALTNQIAAWIALLIVARDIGIVAGWSYLYKRYGVRLLPNPLGKVTDGCLALLLGIVLLRLDSAAAAALTPAVAVLVVASGLSYARMATRRAEAVTIRRLRALAVAKRQERARAAKSRIKGGVSTIP